MICGVVCYEALLWQQITNMAIHNTSDFRDYVAPSLSELKLPLHVTIISPPSHPWSLHVPGVADKIGQIWTDLFIQTTMTPYWMRGDDSW